MFDDVERDIETIRLSNWGHVGRAQGVVRWLVYDGTGSPVPPIREFLTDFVAQGNRHGSVRSYAYGLLRWWRWLRAVGVDWHQATPVEGRDLVLWLMHASKQRVHARTKSLATAGTVNPITRKRYLDDRYAARTIRHSNAVIRAFYQYWIDDRHQGPLVNPIPLDRGRGRPHAHHNPLDPNRPEGRLRYNPKLPKQQPREISDERWRDLFGALASHRDRALLALVVSNGARSEEILGLRMVDVDWGDQLIRVVRKGTRAEQWLPASPESFVWLRLYVAELGHPLTPDEPLWRTCRRRDHGDGLRQHPLTYEALRKVITRVNEKLGTNWTMHDLRHTAALRMARDENLSARDVQTILGHAHLSTTTNIYLVEDQDQVIRRVQQHLADCETWAATPTADLAVGYDPADLGILFGGTWS
jgi:integrase/recombinase XerD